LDLTYPQGERHVGNRRESKQVKTVRVGSKGGGESGVTVEPGKGKGGYKLWQQQKGQ